MALLLLLSVLVLDLTPAFISADAPKKTAAGEVAGRTNSDKQTTSTQQPTPANTQKPSVGKLAANPPAKGGTGETGGDTTTPSTNITTNPGKIDLFGPEDDQEEANDIDNDGDEAGGDDEADEGEDAARQEESEVTDHRSTSSSGRAPTAADEGISSWERDYADAEDDREYENYRRRMRKLDRAATRGRGWGDGLRNRLPGRRWPAADYNDYNHDNIDDGNYSSGADDSNDVSDSGYDSASEQSDEDSASSSSSERSYYRRGAHRERRGGRYGYANTNSAQEGPSSALFRGDSLLFPSSYSPAQSGYKKGLRGVEFSSFPPFIIAFC